MLRTEVLGSWDGRGWERNRSRWQRCHSGVWRNRYQDAGDSKRGDIWFDAVNIDAQDSPRGLKVDDTRVEDLNNGIWAFPIVGQFAIFPEEILNIE